MHTRLVCLACHNTHYSINWDPILWICRNCGHTLTCDKYEEEEQALAALTRSPGPQKGATDCNNCGGKVYEAGSNLCTDCGLTHVTLEAEELGPGYSWERRNPAHSECLCGGPAGHVPFGIHCRADPQDRSTWKYRLTENLRPVISHFTAPPPATKRWLTWVQEWERHNGRTLDNEERNEQWLRFSKFELDSWRAGLLNRVQKVDSSSIPLPTGPGSPTEAQAWLQWIGEEEVRRGTTIEGEERNAEWRAFRREWEYGGLKEKASKK